MPAFATADRVREARCADLSALDEAEALASRGRHAEAERALRRSAAMFERRGQPGPASDAMLACAIRIWHRGHVEESSSLAERARGIAERGGDSERALMALVWLGRTALDRLDAERSEAILRSCVAAAEVGGYTQVRRAAAVALVRTLCWRGQADMAASTGMRSAARSLNRNSLRELTWSSGIDAQLLRVLEHGAAVRIHVARGLAAAASASIRALEQLPASRVPAVQLIASSIRVRWLAALGDVKTLTGQIDDAIRRAREASRPLDAIRVRCAAVEAFAAMGDAPRARDFARSLRHTEGRPLPPLLAVRVALARATAEGRTDLASLSQLRRRGLVNPDTAPRTGSTSPSVRFAMLEDVPRGTTCVAGWRRSGPRAPASGVAAADAAVCSGGLHRLTGCDAGGRERARRSERAARLHQASSGERSRAAARVD